MYARHNTSKFSGYLFLRRQSDRTTSYGWDWGPVLMTIGPWKPIKLHTYDVYLADVDIRILVSESLDAKVSVDMLLSEKISGSASIILKDPQGDDVTEKKIEIEFGNGRAEFEFSSGELQLWYPVRYGSQPLYSVAIVVSDAVSCDDFNS